MHTDTPLINPAATWRGELLRYRSSKQFCGKGCALCILLATVEDHLHTVRPHVRHQKQRQAQFAARLCFLYGEHNLAYQEYLGVYG